MKRALLSIALLTGTLLPFTASALPSLQLFVELTPEGGTLRPPPGTYAGPVVLKRAITLDGGGEVTIDGDGSGTVLTVRADGAVVRGVRLINSGDSFDRVDAGLLLEADDTVIEDNVIEQTLFGIHVKQANGNTIRRNRIRSKPVPLKLRGDGIRMWYSHDNVIEANRLESVRDVFITNSSDNRLAGNRILQSGVGTQLVFSPGNVLEANLYDTNQTGIVILYSSDVVVRGNRIMHSRDVSGSALALKDSSQVHLENNEVLHCAIGLVANAPLSPENILYLTGNRFAYNDIALYFYGEKGGHVIQDNRFEGNFIEVAVTAPTSARANDWRNNHWDRYEGFDRDGDGVGDTPYELYLYSDRIWLDRPMTRFFRASPVMELLDFIERLAPFSDPPLILRDPQPRMTLATEQSSAQEVSPQD